MLRTLTSVLAVHDVAVEHTRIDVYRLGPAFTRAFEREGVAPEIEDALRRAEEADLLIAATPVFRGSYTGLFKMAVEDVSDILTLVATRGRPAD
ncbi:hypothetical protein E1285_00010 [Actinomadura sp. 7K507]|nr:NAD(P)H-dependent oxidoreductase [Actinomadura sp. 7K507]TDC98358.1 hypothetical protein E1285_00010 [Actinomadura sp. 7K507]